MRYVPTDWQAYAIRAVCSRKRVALFMDLGLGKTGVVLKAADWLVNETMEVERILVVAPLKVARMTWRSEAEKFDQFRGLRVSEVLGDERHRLRALSEDADVYVISCGNLHWLRDLYQRDGASPFGMVVLDESTKFKSGSRMHKAALWFCRRTPRAVLLTGTPEPNGLEDLYHQIYLLDMGASLGETEGEFRSRYMEPDAVDGKSGRVYSWKPRPHAEERVYAACASLALSMRASDYLSVPKPSYLYVRLPMPEKTASLCRSIRKDYLATLDGERITAPTAAAVMGKLLQLANGCAYLEDGVYLEVHMEKTVWLRKALLGRFSGMSVLCFYSYKFDRDRLMRDLADFHPRELISQADKDDWDAGRIRLLIAQPASSGYGLNLQKGGHIIVWYGVPWNLELYQQANGRLIRQGQEKPVDVYHLLMEGSEDIDVMRALGGKAATQDRLIDYVKARIKEAKDGR